MSTPHESDPFAFDDHLRSMYDAEEVHDPAATLPDHIWAGVETHLPPAAAPVPAARRAPLFAGIGGVVLGILLMLIGGWWHAEPTQPRPVTPKVNPVSAEVNPFASAGNAASSEVNPVSAKVNSVSSKVSPVSSKVSPFSSKVNSVSSPVNPLSSEVSSGSSAVNTGAPTTGTVAVGGLPVAVTSSPDPAIPVILLPLVATETHFAALGADTIRSPRERRRAVLLQQRVELARLQHRTDSLLLGLGEGTLAAPVAKADSTLARPKRRWSVLLALAPERNFFGLGTAPTDSLNMLRRTHEQGRGGYNASILAEYRLNDRLSVGAGVGTSAYGAELRLTEQRTSVTTRLDSTTVTNYRFDTVRTTAYIIKVVRDSVLAPTLDFNNQVIGYHYDYGTRRDTVWTQLTNTQLSTTTSTTYTPTVTTRQEIKARILKPNYRFLTVPLVVRYRFGRATDWTSSLSAPRWWADVALGAQLQFFLGGTQVVTQDGLTLHTERVGPRGGPFRPFNVALTGTVALNYALTPRFSASLAPTLRYQAESVYKASTNLTQKPTATGLQVGLRYAF